MLAQVKRWFEPLQRYLDRPWYIPLIGLFAALDAVLIIFPIETLMAPAILSKPRRWVAATFWATLGSTVGAVTLAALVRWDKSFITSKIGARVFHSHGWQHTVSFVDAHGALALGTIAASPLPQQPAVVVAALSHMPLMQILLAVTVGRLIKYGVLSYLASHVPRLAAKAKSA